MRPLGLLALATLTACQPLSLDAFLYDPLAAPAAGYQLSTAIIPTHEDLFIRTPDGETLHAVFIPSSGRRRDITLLYFHGQSNNIGSTWPRLEYLYPLGYNLVAVDVRGYGRSTGTPSEPGIHTDLITAHAAVIARPDVDAARLVIYGRSFGGALGIDLAAAHAPAVLVTESAFTSVAALVADGAFVDFPRSFVARANFDNLAKIRGIPSPYLAMHGTADPYVQVKYGHQLADAHAGTTRLVLVPGADHGNVPERLGVQAYRDLLAAFIEEALPPP